MAGNHQDWNPVVFINDNKVITKIKRTGSDDHQHRAALNRRLEADLDVSDLVPVLKPLPKLDKANQQLMIGMRVAKKLSQVELAHRLNVTKDVVAALESGKVITDIFIVKKVNRALGIKLVI